MLYSEWSYYWNFLGKLKFYLVNRIYLKLNQQWLWVVDVPQQLQLMRHDNVDFQTGISKILLLCIFLFFIFWCYCTLCQTLLREKSLILIFFTLLIYIKNVNIKSNKVLNSKKFTEITGINCPSWDTLIDQFVEDNNNYISLYKN